MTIFTALSANSSLLLLTALLILGTAVGEVALRKVRGGQRFPFGSRGALVAGELAEDEVAATVSLPQVNDAPEGATHHSPEAKLALGMGIATVVVLGADLWFWLLLPGTK